MSLLDVLVVLGCVAAAIGGYRLGFLARALSWIGLAAGLYVGARLLPTIVSDVSLSTPAARLALAVAVLLVAAFAGQMLGLVVGQRLHDVLPLGPVRHIDQGVGAVAGGVGVLVLLWLLIPSLTAVPGYPARITADSAISRWLSAHVTPPPDAFQVLRRLVGDESFPQVLNQLRPGGPVGAVPAANPLSASVTTTVAASTVKVEGQACDQIQDGSGFTVATDLIATNAHVVAGEPPGQTRVITDAGRVLPATVVLFDPNRDLALLQVDNLDDTPLPIGSGQESQQVAVFGHPRGQAALAVQPARIAQQIEASGANLYGTAQTKRGVLVLAASLQPGDSGGAVVDPAGSVVGVAFAIAEGQDNTAYALTSAELQAVLAAPHDASVSTGSCLSG